MGATLTKENKTLTNTSLAPQLLKEGRVQKGPPIFFIILSNKKTCLLARTLYRFFGLKD